jgi:hypothetical protein
MTGIKAEMTGIAGTALLCHDQHPRLYISGNIQVIITRAN